MQLCKFSKYSVSNIFFIAVWDTHLLLMQVTIDLLLISLIIFNFSSSFTNEMPPVEFLAGD